MAPGPTLPASEAALCASAGRLLASVRRPDKIGRYFWSFLASVMKTIPATEFKTHCLSLLNEVAKNRETLVVTRHGKPIARVTPYTAEQEQNPLKDSIAFETDVVEPVDEAWDALE
jgi:prevent-host-death family protein